MKYGDFSSLVQLGVGLHLGTALLQLYGEMGVQRFVRTMARARSILDEKNQNEQITRDLIEKYDLLESKYEIFKINLFNEYKKYVKINSVVSIVLILILIAISYVFEEDVAYHDYWITIIIVSISVLPAPITLGSLWIDAERRMKPMMKEAEGIEQKALSEN